MGGQRRGEGDGDAFPRHAAEVLDHLGGVPVAAADAVRRHGAHDLAAEQVRLGCLAGAGGAGGGDDHRFWPGEPGGVGGEEGEGDGGGVATGYRDALGPLQRGAGTRKFGEAVGPGAGVRGAVEGLPVGGVLQPEVGAHVDDEHVGAELFGDGRGLAVRQREEDHVVPGERVGGGLREHSVGQRQQMRLERAERLSGVGVAGQGADLDLGVGEEKTQDFSARVSARSGHRHSYCHVHPPPGWHDYTQRCTFMQSLCRLPAAGGARGRRSRPPG
ncbi:hypothetical protein GCM10020256_63950 [Streptomyces thermocoprophilus]